MPFDKTIYFSIFSIWSGDYSGFTPDSFLILLTENTFFQDEAVTKKF